MAYSLSLQFGPMPGFHNIKNPLSGNAGLRVKVEEENVAESPRWAGIDISGGK